MALIDAYQEALKKMSQEGPPLFTKEKGERCAAQINEEMRGVRAEIAQKEFRGMLALKDLPPIMATS